MGLKKELPSFHSQISITMHRNQKEKKLNKNKKTTPKYSCK